MGQMAPGVPRNGGPESCQVLSGNRCFFMPCYFGDTPKPPSSLFHLATSKEETSSINALRSGPCHREDTAHLPLSKVPMERYVSYFYHFNFLAARPLRGALISGSYSLGQRAIYLFKNIFQQYFLP